MRLVAVAVGLALAGCASVPVDTGAAADAAALARARALTEAGCYDCLLEARDLYEARAASDRREGILRRLFEVQLLLVAREKELALDSAATLTAAENVAAELAAGLPAERYLEIVQAIVPDGTGTPRREMPRVDRDARERIDADIAWLRDAEAGASGLLPTVDAYLALSLECGPRGIPGRAAPAAEAEPDASAYEPPLLAYRRAICGRPDGDLLTDVLGQVPGFVEANLFLGRLATVALQRTGGREARQYLDAAYARFPDSPAVTVAAGSFNRAVGDCTAAVRFYSETLALRQAHEDARLSRAICHTYLGDPDSAIADATVLIDELAPNRGDAYYWRAWNQRTLGELDLARADIDRGRALLVNGLVLTLAGMIEHDQDDLDPAEADLLDAIGLDADNCTARAYLALVDVKRREWVRGAERFVEAADCYDAAVRFSEQERAALLAMVENPELEFDPVFVEQQLLGFDAAIADDRSQESRASLNAALMYFRAGDRGQAAAFAARADRDPARAERVAELRELLEDDPAP